VRARTQHALPRRLSAPTRLFRASLAPFAGTREIQDAHDPARFTRGQQRSPIGRARETWRYDYQRALEAAIQEPEPQTCQTVAVLSPKGGVGKTTTTGLLGMLLQYTRSTVTVAVDANPDKSNLATVLHTRGKMLDELLRSSLADGKTSTPMEVLAELGSAPHGLRVAPSPNTTDRALSKDGYLTVYNRLKAVSEALVLDCGTGLFAPAAQAAIETADQLVVVVNGKPDTLAMVTEDDCLQLLRAFDGPVFLAVNMLTSRSRRRINLAQFEHELSFAQGIIELSFHETAAENLSTFRWDDRPPRDWADGVRELAALITSTWPTTR
jgi:MinD-like ATPase involved in chromosome partitioning or flagellar assembly